MRIVATGIGKRFRYREILKNISFEVNPGESIVVTGRNGSGKTTLMKILCGLMPPTEGAVEYYEGETRLSRDAIYGRVSLVGPYVQFYRDLSAWENLVFVAQSRQEAVDENRMKGLFARLGLAGREHDLLRTYSSGMAQRLKYAAALYHVPDVLMVDEPTSNLDEEGKTVVREVVELHSRDHAVVVATNEREELNWGQRRVTLG